MSKPTLQPDRFSQNAILLGIYFDIHGIRAILQAGLELLKASVPATAQIPDEIGVQITTLSAALKESADKLAAATAAAPPTP
jgi:hypothetical protein